LWEKAREITAECQGGHASPPRRQTMALDFLRMNVMRVLAIANLIVLVIASNVYADEETKRERIVVLLKASGAYEGIEKSLQASREYLDSYRDITIQQIRLNYHSIDIERIDKIEEAYNKFYNDIEPRWSTEEAIEQYITLFAEYYKEEEIEKLIQLTQAPIWQKSLIVSKEIGPKWDKWIIDQHDIVLNEAMSVFMEEYKGIIEDISDADCDWKTRESLQLTCHGLSFLAFGQASLCRTAKLWR